MTPGADAPTVLSADNPKIKQARRLARSRRERAAAGRYVIEGPGLVRDASSAEVPLDYVLVPDEVARPDLTGVRAPVFVVPQRSFASIATTVTPQPALAVAVTAPHPVVIGRGLVLVLAAIADPGNAGTLIRAAEAAGSVGVFLVGSSVDPFGPKTVRSSAGSVFRMPLESVSVADLRQRVADAEVIMWGAIAVGGEPCDEVWLGGAPLVVVGNERHGIDEGLGVDHWVSIPMAGGPESLNVAMAGTVLLFEAARQRRNGRGSD
ncbi:MAG: RNA methyltransferase [Acidimicrobiia bacterium]|nr:RNA methyltransferase [Acidimicrobiia bacterium]